MLEDNRQYRLTELVAKGYRIAMGRSDSVMRRAIAYGEGEVRLLLRFRWRDRQPERDDPTDQFLCASSTVNGLWYEPLD